MILTQAYDETDTSSLMMRTAAVRCFGLRVSYVPDCRCAMLRTIVESLT